MGSTKGSPCTDVERGSTRDLVDVRTARHLHETPISWGTPSPAPARRQPDAPDEVEATWGEPGDQVGVDAPLLADRTQYAVVAHVDPGVIDRAEAVGGVVVEVDEVSGQERVLVRDDLTTEVVDRRGRLVARPAQGDRAARCLVDRVLGQAGAVVSRVAHCPAVAVVAGVRIGIGDPLARSARTTAGVAVVVTSHAGDLTRGDGHNRRARERCRRSRRGGGRNCDSTGCDGHESSKK